MRAIANPRKALRLRLACPVTLACRELRWSGDTRDVSPAGCCVPAPGPLQVGDLVHALLVCPTSRRRLVVKATVAWCTQGTAWRAGLSFQPESRTAAGSWFDEVAARHLQHLYETEERVPDLLPLSARLQVGQAPAASVLREEEAALLRLAGQGATLQAVVGRLAGTWTRSQRSLFTMLGNGWITLDQRPTGEEPAGHASQEPGPTRTPTGLA